MRAIQLAPENTKVGTDHSKTPKTQDHSFIQHKTKLHFSVRLYFCERRTNQTFFRSHKQTTDDITAFLGFIANGKTDLRQVFFDITHRLNISLTPHKTFFYHTRSIFTHTRERE